MEKISATKIIEIFNKITGRQFRATGQNISVINARLKENYTLQDITEVIISKHLEWKDNAVMRVHICPKTIFRASNFEKYYNEVLIIRKNPEKYKKHYERLNKTKSSTGAFAKIDRMFDK